MGSDYTRRQFLEAAGATASLAILGQSCRSIIERPPIERPPRPTRLHIVRRDVAGLNKDDAGIKGYIKAITAMKALPADNPLSWTYQAGIHWSDLPGPHLDSWDKCVHHDSPPALNSLFWSWHRMYLYWFERIVRKHSGNLNWALPYWNWTKDRELPAMFRDPTSQLYVAERDSAINDLSNPALLPVSAVNYSQAFNADGFNTASRRLESGPHDNVHVLVGGGFGSVDTAAKDPIFYLHHCNIDRLWNLWLAQFGGRTDPLSDSTWRETKFAFFDENGNKVEMTSCDILNASKQLNYLYEREPDQVEQACPTTLIPAQRVTRPEQILRQATPQLLLTSETVSLSIDITDVRPRLNSIVQSETDALTLELHDVEAERQPGVIWEVYAGVQDVTALNAEGPYFIGTVALFSDGIRNSPHRTFKPAQFQFPIARQMKRLLEQNQDRLPITFVPRSTASRRPDVRAAVRIAEIRLKTSE
jgi:hypothetical protein